MPYVEAKTVIEGDIDEIYEIIKDMQSYPKFMHDHTVSHWVSNVDGRRIVWTERDTFYEGDKRIAYQQIKGDLKKMEGQWSLKQMEDGVEVLLTVDFEFGIPMIAGLLNPLLKKKVRENSENMLSAVKSQIEMHR
jgi:ribosome-associated toxin RatA of RatAB toxin-antitoxin module